MLSIYQNSTFNVAAGSSLDPDGGLFRSRCQEDIASHTISTDVYDAAGERLMISDEHMWQHHVLSSPLHQRGWVLQERLVASRTLHFTGHQIFWQCTTHQACETFPEGLLAYPDQLPPIQYQEIEIPRPLFQQVPASTKDDEPNTPSQKAMDTWNAIIANYSVCAVTKESDNW